MSDIRESSLVVVLALVKHCRCYVNGEIMKICDGSVSIVMQLLIFGVYIAEIKIKEIDLKLNIIVTVNKFIIFPLAGYAVLKAFEVKDVYFNVAILEILTPLAVTNVNLAALFDLYPNKVAMCVIVTSVLFLLGFFIFF